MEFNANTVQTLRDHWRSLYNEVTKTRKFRFEIFESAFSQTYSLLADYAQDTCLDKQCIQMIAEAYLFANIKEDSLESICLAATVLTERMLSSFAFAASTDVPETSSVYLLESHEEIVLDFRDVNESISALTKAYDNSYWKKLRN